MKPKASLRSFLALSGSALLAITAAQADTLYWDGTTPGGNAGGGNGTWDNTTANWSTLATGGSAIDWDDLDFAIFLGTAGTVNLGTPIITSSLQFNTTGYTINTGANTLSFGAANNTISTNGIAAATITGTVGGSGNVAFSALLPTTYGTVNFNGASAGGWSGTTTIGQGMVVRLSDTNQALLNTSGITLNGGLLYLANVAAQNTLNRVKDTAAITSYGGSIRYDNIATASTAYSESLGALTLENGYTNILNIKQSSGTGSTQTLSFASLTRNGYALLNVGSQGGLNTTTNVIKFGGQTATATNKIIGPWAFAGNETSSGDYAIFLSNNGEIGSRNAGTTAEASWTTAWADTANLHYSNVTSTLTANRVMNTLRGRANVLLGNNTLATYGFLNSGGTVEISASGTGYLTIPTDAGNSALYINSANGGTTVSAPIKDNGSAKLTLVASGAHNGGVLTLSGNNTYTGGTVINSPGNTTTAGAGLPGFGGGVRLATGGNLGASTNFLQVDSGRLELNGISVGVGKLDGIAGYITNGTGTPTLTVGNGDATGGNFQGNIGNNVSLTKVGTGTQTLSGINTYTGASTVSAGTLLVNGSLGASAVTVNSGAFGGSGTIGSTLNLAGGSFHVVDLFDALQVAGTVTLYSGFGIDDLAGLTWGSVADGTYTLINGTLGTGVFAGLANNSLATAYDIGGGRSAYFQEGSLQLVVIPEPRAALLGGLGLLALLRRRRA